MGVLPNFVAKIHDFATIEALVNNERVRYVAPLNDYFYFPPGMNGQGMGEKDDVPVEVRGDYDIAGRAGCVCDVGRPFEKDDVIPVFSPFNGLIPWNYSLQGINQTTWNTSSGAGIE
ncbi:MAG: hypothetical protein R2795_23980 [Saprospiraceae bacterium]